MSRLVDRNLNITRGRTSMRLEPELWDALAEISRRENRDMHDLIKEIDAGRSEGTRTSAVRVFLLQYFRAAASVVG